MNTMLFWDKKANEGITVKVTQNKLAIWRGQGVTVRQANRIAKERGWVHITTRTKLREMLGKGVG